MIRVLLADDHGFLRAGVRLLVERQSDMAVVAEARDTGEAIELTSALTPDVAVLDLTMPGGGGVAAMRKLGALKLGTRFVALSMHTDAAHVQAALRAGASAYVAKSAADRQLLAAIRAAHAGQENFTLGVDAADPGSAARPLRSGSGAALSSREKQVLALIARGHTQREIADQLDISVKTVETFRARIAEKLQLRTRAELTAYASAAGLVDDT